MAPYKKFDAVLPLLMKDYGRFEILDKSIKKHLRDINVCWVIATDREYGEIHRKIENDMYRVIPESILLPELEFYKRISRLLYRPIFRRTSVCVNRRFNIIGWYVQQLVKLAMAEKVGTEFYLTLDADVVCLRKVGYEDLIQNGKAITNTTDEDHHPDWYENAKRVLHLPRSGITHGVTPAVFHREAVIALQGFLAKKVHPFLRFISNLSINIPKFENIFSSWSSYLMRNTPWTEYSLYYTFLEAMDLFDKYHIRKGNDAIYDMCSSLWLKEQINTWEIENKFKRNSYFLIIQSNTGYPVDEIWEKLRNYLE